MDNNLLNKTISKWMGKTTMYPYHKTLKELKERKLYDDATERYVDSIREEKLDEIKREVEKNKKKLKREKKKNLKKILMMKIKEKIKKLRKSN